MQLNIEKKQAPKSLIKRRVLKGDHPESENISNFGFSVTGGQQMHIIQICELSGLHKLCYPTIWDRSTWSKFRAHGEHGDVFLFSNLGAL